MCWACKATKDSYTQDHRYITLFLIHNNIRISTIFYFGLIQKKRYFVKIISENIDKSRKFKLWRPVYQKRVSGAGTSNYTPQYLWDVITCPCPRPASGTHWVLIPAALDAITTSLLRENDVATSFWLNDDVIIASCARWDAYGGGRWFPWPSKCHVTAWWRDTATLRIATATVLCHTAVLYQGINHTHIMPTTTVVSVIITQYPGTCFQWATYVQYHSGYDFVNVCNFVVLQWQWALKAGLNVSWKQLRTEFRNDKALLEKMGCWSCCTYEKTKTNKNKNIKGYRKQNISQIYSWYE